MNSVDSTGFSALPAPDFSRTFPGPIPVSPHADHIEQHALQWLGEFPLLSSAEARRTLCNITGQGVAHTFPAADRESLVLCADLFLWLTAFDDVYGEVAAVRAPVHLVDHVSELMCILAGDGVTDTESPFAAALRDLLTRFRVRATPAQYLRLTGHLRDSLFGIVWEAHHLAEPERVTLAAYCAMRHHTVFVRTIMATAEIALNYELPDRQRALVPVLELETAVANLAGWINDLASHEREAARSLAQPLSLPTLLQARQGSSMERAFAQVCRMCEEQAAIARLRIDELTSTSAGSALGLHARALEGIARSFIWHTGHARYR